MAIPEVTAALAKQSSFNTALVSKLTEVATALSARAKTSDLLDGSGKIKPALLPFALSDLLTLKGPVDLNTNPGFVTTGSGTEGDIWFMSADATGLSIDGITEVKTGDWLWSIDGKWNRLPMGGNGGGVAGLTSFNGRTAANVVPTAGDYSAAQVSVAALTTLSGADVQAVLVAIDAALVSTASAQQATDANVADLIAGFTSLGTNFDAATTSINAITVS